MSQIQIMSWGDSHSVLSNVLDCDIIESNFEFHSHSYIQSNSLRKGMKPLYPSYGLNDTTIVFQQQGWLWV